MSDALHGPLPEDASPGWEPMYRVGYAKDPYGDGDSRWWVWPPGLYSAFPLDDRWTVQQHEDGTITVSPSIAVGKDGGDYHGFLTAGEWRQI